MAETASAVGYLRKAILRKAVISKIDAEGVITQTDLETWWNDNFAAYPDNVLWELYEELVIQGDVIDIVDVT